PPGFHGPHGVARPLSGLDVGPSHALPLPPWRGSSDPKRAAGRSRSRPLRSAAASRRFRGPPPPRYSESPRPARSVPRAGRSSSSIERGAVMADETYAGEFYCVKCREKREAEGNVVVSNGRRMAKAVCPECGTKLNRILGKA